MGGIIWDFAIAYLNLKYISVKSIPVNALVNIRESYTWLFINSCCQMWMTLFEVRPNFHWQLLNVTIEVWGTGHTRPSGVASWRHVCAFKGAHKYLALIMIKPSAPPFAQALYVYYALHRPTGDSAWDDGILWPPTFRASSKTAKSSTAHYPQVTLREQTATVMKFPTWARMVSLESIA